MEQAPQGKRDVFGDGHEVEQGVVLEQHADALPVLVQLHVAHGQHDRCPSTVTLPRSGRISPVIMRSSRLFPDAPGPIRPNRQLSGTFRLTSLSTARSKLLETPSRRINARPESLRLVARRGRFGLASARPDHEQGCRAGPDSSTRRRRRCSAAGTPKRESPSPGRSGTARAPPSAAARAPERRRPIPGRGPTPAPRRRPAAGCR